MRRLHHTANDVGCPQGCGNSAVSRRSVNIIQISLVVILQELLRRSEEELNMPKLNAPKAAECLPQQYTCGLSTIEKRCHDAGESGSRKHPGLPIQSLLGVQVFRHHGPGCQAVAAGVWLDRIELATAITRPVADRERVVSESCIPNLGGM